jgi:hypothetical protein
MREHDGRLAPTVPGMTDFAEGADGLTIGAATLSRPEWLADRILDHGQDGARRVLEPGD